MSIVNDINWKQWTSEQAGEQAQVTYEKYKKIKSFQDVGYLLTYYVVSGGEVTKNFKRNDMIDVTDIVASLDDNILSRDGMSFETGIPNTTYYLDFNKDGDWHWGTMNAPGETEEDFLTIVEVATDELGMVSLIVDKRGHVGGMRLKDDFGLEEYAKKEIVDEQLEDITHVLNNAYKNANYFNNNDGKWYVDESFTTLSDDDTDIIQQAINKAYGGSLKIPKGNYKINPLELSVETALMNRTGLLIEDSINLFFDDATFVCDAQTYNSGYYFLTIYNAKNVNISGKALFIGDRFSHVGPGEWGHLIVIRGSSDVYVGDGIYLKDAFGDCVVIGGSQPATNVRIHNVVMEGGRRQNLTIGSGSEIYIENCLFIKNGDDTSNTNPKAHIDVEPDDINTQLKNLYFRNCTFNSTMTTYNSPAIVFSTAQLTTITDTVMIAGCVFNNNNGDILVNKCKNVIIDGNIDTGMYSGSSWIDSIGVISCENVTISNNIINSSTYGGISIKTSSKVNCNNNYISNTALQSIEVLSSSEIQIVSNRIKNSGTIGNAKNKTNILIELSSKCIVNSNDLGFGFYNIYLLSTTDVMICNNLIHDFQRDSIYQQTNNAKIRIEGNNFYNLGAYSSSKVLNVEQDSIIKATITNNEFSLGTGLGDRIIWYTTTSAKDSFILFINNIVRDIGAMALSGSIPVNNGYALNNITATGTDDGINIVRTS